jgi:D-glycero-D-manno-heptose 1,7-bisphosphate phosphatase
VSERARPGLFLDRDGVLNTDTGYVHRAQDFQWMPGAFEAVREAHDRGYVVLVVTNQSGVGRGYYDEVAVHALHDWMQQQMHAHGTAIDAFYYCPHDPEADCECRKPRPGMFLQAIRDWNLDPAASLSIGDKQRDLEASAAAGIRAGLFTGGNLAAFLRQFAGWPQLPDDTPAGSAT